MITKTSYTFGESFPSNFNAQEQDHVFPASSIVKIMPAIIRCKTSKNQPYNTWLNVNILKLRVFTFFMILNLNYLVVNRIFTESLYSF